MCGKGFPTNMPIGGLIAEIGSGGAPTYLTDALGSVRDLTDLAGTATGTSDFDIFSIVRAQTNEAEILKFTGRIK